MPQEGSFSEEPYAQQPQRQQHHAPFRTLDEFLQRAADEALHNRQQHRRPWPYWWMFLSLGVANSSDATEILCLSFLLADETFQEDMLKSSFNNSHNSAGNLAAAVFLGMLLGGLLVGTAGDVWGRRPVLLTGCAVNATAGILASITTHVVILTTCRFVAGVGIGATVPPLFTLCSELAPPAHRGFWVAVVASFWMVGSLFVAAVGYCVFTLASNGTFLFGLTSWRLFLFLCALPSLVGGLLVARHVPESPRFLALHGQYARAVQVVQSLGTKLGISTSTFTPIGPPWSLTEARAQFPPSTRTINPHHVPTSFSSMWKTACLELYRSTRLVYTKHLWAPMLGLQIVWASLSFGSYGLTTWINSIFTQVHLHDVYFNAFLFALSNLPGNLLSAYLLDTWGRTTMLTGSLLAASASLAVFGYAASAMSQSPHRDFYIVSAACAFQAFTIAAWNTIDVWTAEVFPTAVRSTALGLCAATGRLAAMAAQIVNGALIAQPARLLVTSAVSLAVGAFVPCCWIPDWTGRSVLDQVEDSTSESRDGHDTEEESREFLPSPDHPVNDDFH